MSESNASNNLPLTNPDIEYERRDVNTKWVAIAIASIFVLIVIAMSLTFWLLGTFNTIRVETEPTPLPLIELRPTPPPPRLQPNLIDRATAEEELRILREREDAILTSYEWVDRDGGIVRIPIERAIELLAEQEEPAR